VGLCGFFLLQTFFLGFSAWVLWLARLSWCGFFVRVLFSQVCAGSCGSAGCWCGFVCAGCAGFFAAGFFMWVCAGLYVWVGADLFVWVFLVQVFFMWVCEGLCGSCADEEVWVMFVQAFCVGHAGAGRSADHMQHFLYVGCVGFRKSDPPGHRSRSGPGPRTSGRRTTSPCSIMFGPCFDPQDGTRVR